jgi:hypothetical protein
LIPTLVGVLAVLLGVDIGSGVLAGNALLHLVLVLVVAAGFWVEHRARAREFAAHQAQMQRGIDEARAATAAEFDRTRHVVEQQFELVRERLDGHLRVLVVADGKAKESIEAVNQTVHQFDLLEARVASHDQRLTAIERAQDRVLEAARELIRRDDERLRRDEAEERRRGAG